MHCNDEELPALVKRRDATNRTVAVSNDADVALVIFLIIIVLHG